MIIKHIPIKHRPGNSARVIDYIASDKGRIKDYREQSVFRNLLKTDLASIREAFEVNYNDFAIKLPNGNEGMHIALSMNPLDRDKISMEMMDDIANTYIDRVFPDAIVFGAHHISQDTSNLHTHLYVSGNKFMSKSGTRISTKELRDSHQFMLDYLKEKYPELSQGIDMDRWGEKHHSEGAYYAKSHHPDQLLEKEQLAEQLQDIFRSCESTKEFYEKLDALDFDTYEHKGETKGVFWNDRGTVKKMRFERLGIDKSIFKELDQQHERLKELEDLRSEAYDPEIETSEIIEAETEVMEDDQDEMQIEEMEDQQQVEVEQELPPQEINMQEM